MITDSSHIINRLKATLDLKTDLDLANYLGVSSNTIATWKKRNSINYDLIFSKSDSINLHWLLTGKGPVKGPSIELSIVEKAIKCGIKTAHDQNLSPENESFLLLQIIRQIAAEKLNIDEIEYALDTFTKLITHPKINEGETIK